MSLLVPALTVRSSLDACWLVSAMDLYFAGLVNMHSMIVYGQAFR